MEITKTVPVTILVQEQNVNACDLDCSFLTDDGDWCCKFAADIDIEFSRCPACLAEFGTGEKENEK